METVYFVAATLATWRLATMLYMEQGPADVWLKLRILVSRWAFWNEQINCFWCCTVLAALVIWPLYVWAPWLVVPLGLSGGAVLLSKGGRVVWREMSEHELEDT